LEKNNVVRSNRKSRILLGHFMVSMRSNVEETTRTSAETQLGSLQQQQQQHFCKHGAPHPNVSQEKQNYSGSTATYNPHLSLQHIFSVPKI
jgi:hypothetical protein